MWRIECKSSDYRKRPWAEWQDFSDHAPLTLEEALSLALQWKAQGQAVRITWEEVPS